MKPHNMNAMLKKATISAVPVAVIFTIVRFVSPILFASFEKLPVWVTLTEGFAFFIILTVCYYFYDLWKKSK